MDAIGKWENGVLIAVKNYGKACAHNAQSPATFELEQAQEDAYVAVCNELRTTPEGFALVPVPEWVPVGERLPVVPEVESMINVWYAYKDFVGACPISRDGAWSLPSHATHWQHNYEPAPPKSESL